MSDLVGNPEDWFSHVAAQLYHVKKWSAAIGSQIDWAKTNTKEFALL